ncbi:hypothetical protein SAMN05216601_102324 [Ectopseudomonas composti]|uniref:Uncharacterized protein n=1 Tax=Ectopseudomonas composti TaxID=658457 RepID=A0A1I5KAB2_9GAMM|nr:hypothetical protein SAMN05216601_102324 [Pseudomonas composti]
MEAFHPLSFLLLLISLAYSFGQFISQQPNDLRPLRWLEEEVACAPRASGSVQRERAARTPLTPL